MGEVEGAGQEGAEPGRPGSVFARMRARLVAAFAKDQPVAPPIPAAEAPPPPPPMPKRVGILTLPLHTNYGGNLQAFALFEMLKDLGHRPVVINRRRFRNRQIAAPTPPGLTGPMVAAYAPNRREPSFAFIDAHLGPFTREFLTSDELRDGIGDYELDAIVVGSDQIWRPVYAKALLDDFFLGFLPVGEGGPLRISYAASFGADRWEYSAEEEAAARAMLARFEAVSVREDGAVDLCRRHLGVEAAHVLDPTLLLSPDRYRALFASRPEVEPRVLAYVLDARDDTARVVEQVSAALGIDAYATDGQRFGATEAGDTSIEGWLAAFACARFVVTD